MSCLAVQGKVAASTQNQVLSALVFLSRHVLRQAIGGQIEAVRAKQSRYLPTGLTHEEAITVLSKLSGTHPLVAQILYRIGLRISEALSLRVKGIDFAQSQREFDDALEAPHPKPLSQRRYPLDRSRCNH